jgi:hypothetical protein
MVVLNGRAQGTGNEGCTFFSQQQVTSLGTTIDYCIASMDLCRVPHSHTTPGVFAPLLAMHIHPRLLETDHCCISLHIHKPLRAQSTVPRGATAAAAAARGGQAAAAHYVPYWTDDRATAYRQHYVQHQQQIREAAAAIAAEPDPAAALAALHNLMD